jgi:dipeptidyl aminopeptidase/acylaminoacyl peptidase
MKRRLKGRPTVPAIVAAAVVAASCSVGGTAAADAPAKIPLGYRAYDGWNAIRGTVVSDDGRYAAYALVPEDGDPTLVVHDFQTGGDHRELRGTGPVFSADGRYVVFTRRAPNIDIHTAQRAHKKPEDGPKNGIGILDLTANALTTVEGVKDFKLPRDGGSDTLAYLLASPLPEPAAVPSGSPKPGPAHSPPAAGSPLAVPSASAAPSPSPSPDDLHKNDPAATLVIDDLATGSESQIGGVTAYAVAHDGAFVAYALASKDGRLDALDVRVSATGRTIESMRGAGHYKNLTFAPKHERLAFVSDAATFGDAAPWYALYQADFAADPAAARAAPLVDATTAGFGDAPPSEYGALRYTKDGARLFFGAAPAPTPVPSATPDPVKVDIWNWQDRDLQSVQRKDADDERKRTFAAVAATDGSRAVRLADANVRTIVSNENADIALGIDDVRYRKAESWDSEFDDVYGISLADGTRRLLVSKQRNDPTFPGGDPRNEPALSPHGGFAVAYDPVRRDWFSVDTHGGRRIELTARLEPAFYDELDDRPAPPPPYGIAGWIDGDRYVLLRDRYDVWAVDPRTGAARSLTGGSGRRRHVIFTPERTDPDADSFDSRRPIVLHARDEDTGDQGFWQVRAAGPAAFAPQRIVMLPKAVTFVAKARSAERIAVFEQSFAELLDLWSAPDAAAPLVRLSEANPQRAAYLWGDETLVSYRSTWGVPLRGILYTPENLDRRKKHPMLVYFYERFSDLFHAMPFTTPAPNTSPTLIRYVSNGYVVFVPDVAYRVGHPGESALDCILPAVDAVVRRGFVDPARIGIAGHSWGAYQIAYLLTRTNRFRAAEAGAAVANMTSAYGGIRLESGRVRESQYETGQSRIGSTPWDRTDLYIENSALFHLRAVNTPYLTIANDLDGAVPQAQGIEFFTGLRRLGKEAYLFSFDGEDHNLKGREQLKYWTVHLDEFFDRFLLGKPAPDWMTHGVDFLHRGRREIDATYYGESF